MREIWESPFGYASLKIERAKQHVIDLEQRISTSSDRYGPSLHINMQTGEQFVYYRFSDRELTRDIALIVGDAIHNLHCALDIAWCAVYTALVSNANSKFRKFPIYPKESRQNFESRLRGEVPPTCTLFDLVFNGVKPYQGGDGDILALHQLDIDDKHHLLIPMVHVTSIEGAELEYPDGTIDCLTIALSRPNSYRKVVPLDTKIKKHGEARFSITFREGDALKGEEVVPTLRRFVAKISRIVRVMQRMK